MSQSLLHLADDIGNDSRCQQGHILFLRSIFQQARSTTEPIRDSQRITRKYRRRYAQGVARVRFDRPEKTSEGNFSFY